MSKTIFNFTSSDPISVLFNDPASDITIFFDQENQEFVVFETIQPDDSRYFRLPYRKECSDRLVIDEIYRTSDEEIRNIIDSKPSGGVFRCLREAGAPIDEATETVLRNFLIDWQNQNNLKLPI